MLFNCMICSVRKHSAYETTFTRYETLSIMPRTAGVSCSSDTEFTRRSPSPRTVARWSWRVPIKPLTSFTLIVLAIRVTSTKNFFDRLAALGSDLGRRIHAREAIQRRADHVVRVGRAVRLGHHVGHTHDFENCAHRTAGNHAGTILCRRDHHGRRAVATGYRVLQRTVAQRHLDLLATSLFHRLLHGNRNILRLAFAHADATVAVTDDRQRSETHDTAALAHFRDPVH